MIVYKVTPIFEQINGFAGVCFPQLDAEGNYILSVTSLDDALIADIHSLIAACELIDYNPIIQLLE